VGFLEEIFLIMERLSFWIYIYSLYLQHLIAACDAMGCFDWLWCLLRAERVDSMMDGVLN
jgi:hypothetical protein